MFVCFALVCFFTCNIFDGMNFQVLLSLFEAVFLHHYYLNWLFSLWFMLSCVNDFVPSMVVMCLVCNAHCICYNPVCLEYFFIVFTFCMSFYMKWSQFHTFSFPPKYSKIDRLRMHRRLKIKLYQLKSNFRSISTN